jgi:hypothetical protein
VTQSSISAALSNGVKRGYLETTKVLLGLDVSYPQPLLEECVRQASLRGHDHVSALLQWYMAGSDAKGAAAHADD